MTGKDFSPELRAKAAKCKTAEELHALAKENNINLTEEQVSGILSAEDLDAVAGGKVAQPLPRGIRMPPQ